MGNPSLSLIGWLAALARAVAEVAGEGLGEREAGGEGVAVAAAVAQDVALPRSVGVASQVGLPGPVTVGVAS